LALFGLSWRSGFGATSPGTTDVRAGAMTMTMGNEILTEIAKAQHVVGAS